MIPVKDPAFEEVRRWQWNYHIRFKAIMERKITFLLDAFYFFYRQKRVIINVLAQAHESNEDQNYVVKNHQHFKYITN